MHTQPCEAQRFVATKRVLYCGAKMPQFAAILLLPPLVCVGGEGSMLLMAPVMHVVT